MSASQAFQVALVKHLLQNAAIANIGDAAGLPAAATVGNLYVTLHTADPGEAGDQTTNEAAYVGYARVPVVRSAAGWTVDATDGHYSNAADITFGKSTDANSTTITHGSIGVAASGAGMILYSGALASPLAVATGVTPVIKAGTLTGTVD